MLPMGPSDIPIRVLRYFAAAARLGSLTAAAEFLSISQPSISTAISRIEEELNVQLFLRRPSQGVRLTAAGERVYDEVRQFLGHVDGFHDSIRNVSSELAGEIHFACFINLGPIVMAELLGSFRKLHPTIHVSFTEMNHSDLIDGVLDGTFEMALGFDLEIPQEVKIDYISERAPQFVLRPDHRLADRKSIFFEELASDPFILMDLPYTDSYFLSLFATAQVRPNIVYHARSFETLRCLVGAGLGYGLLNIFPKIDLTYNGDRLIKVPVANSARPLNLLLMRHPRVRPRLITTVFADHVKQFLR